MKKHIHNERNNTITTQRRKDEINTITKEIKTYIKTERTNERTKHITNYINN